MVYPAHPESTAHEDKHRLTVLFIDTETFRAAKTWTTASHAQQVIGAISLEWWIITTASVPSVISVPVSWVPVSVVQAVVAWHQEPEVEVNATCVPVVIIALMIPLMCKGYHVRREPIVLLALPSRRFVLEVLIALEQQKYQNLAQVRR